jgi:hypothetical protein
VLLNAYRALDGFEERAPFSAWLFAITRRRCIRAMRPRRLMRDEDVIVEHVEDPSPTPERALEYRDEADLLLRVMQDRLQPREQEAIWLRYVERATVDDITRTLGLANVTGARTPADRAPQAAGGHGCRSRRPGECAMSTPHLTDAEIAEAPASLTDVRRRHLDECVRCRLRVSRYRAFVAAPEHVPSRDLADAEARLTAFLDERTGAGLAPARPAPTRSGRRAGWLPEWLGGSAWQPAFALSAIAVIGAGVLWISAERTREARVLRGTVARSAIAVAPAVPLESGGLSLHWTPVAGADRYELRFYAPDASGFCRRRHAGGLDRGDARRGTARALGSPADDPPREGRSIEPMGEAT